MTRNFRTFAASLAIMAVLSPALSQAKTGDMSLCFSGLFDYSMTNIPRNYDKSYIGGGGYMYFDGQWFGFAPWASLGLGVGYNRFVGDTVSFNTMPIDLMGRIILKDEPDKMAPMLIGGAGRNLAYKNTRPWANSSWIGKWQAYAGAGVRTPLGKGSPMKLETSLVYTFHTPLREFDWSLHSVGVRVGLVTVFPATKGPSTPKAKKEEKGEPVIAAPAITGQEDMYTVQPKDTLWVIACRKNVYGDCELYPVLVAGNKDKLKSPADVLPGVVLKIPKNLTESYKDQARKLAWSEQYIPWRGSKVTREKYEAWKSGKQGTAPKPAAAPAAAAKPAGKAYKTEDWYTIQPNDTLWAIACRKAGLGDCELYPLLVDANKDVLKSPADIKPGVLIKIPKDLSDSDKKAAVEKAWTDAYVPWRGANVTKAKYDAWKKVKATGQGK